MGGRRTFLEEPPGAEEGVLQPQPGEGGVLLEAGVQPPHQRVHRGVAEAEGGRGKHVGHGGVHGGVVALIGAHVPPEGLGAQDFGEVVSHGDDLQRREHRRASEQGRLQQGQGAGHGPHPETGRTSPCTRPGARGVPGGTCLAGKGTGTQINGYKLHPQSSGTYGTGGHVSDTPRHPSGKATQNVGTRHADAGAAALRPASPGGPPARRELRAQVGNPGASGNLRPEAQEAEPGVLIPPPPQLCDSEGRGSLWTGFLMWKTSSVEFPREQEAAVVFLGLLRGVHVADSFSESGPAGAEDSLSGSGKEMAQVESYVRSEGFS